MELKLREVTEFNYEEIVGLKVAKEQENFIESNEMCIKEAKELSLWRPKGIYDKDELIGFTMYGLFDDEGEQGKVWLDRFMIGFKYQGRGYGKACVKFLVQELCREYSCSTIYLSVYEDNLIAINLYKSIGFKFNGELDINGEKVMEINL